MELGTFQNLKFTWNSLLKPSLRSLTWKPFLGTLSCLEPSLKTFYLEPRNLRDLYLEPFLVPSLGTLEPLGSFTWNPYLERRNLPEPLLGTLTCLEPSLKTLCLEPSNLMHPYLEPFLGTAEPFTWNPYLEPRNLAEPCGWLPQSSLGPSLTETQKFLVGEKWMKKIKHEWHECSKAKGFGDFKYCWHGMRPQQSISSERHPGRDFSCWTFWAAEVFFFLNAFCVPLRPGSICQLLHLVLHHLQPSFLWQIETLHLLVVSPSWEALAYCAGHLANRVYTKSSSCESLSRPSLDAVSPWPIPSLDNLWSQPQFHAASLLVYVANLYDHRPFCVLELCISTLSVRQEAEASRTLSPWKPGTEKASWGGQLVPDLLFFNMNSVNICVNSFIHQFIYDHMRHLWFQKQECFTWRVFKLGKLDNYVPKSLFRKIGYGWWTIVAWLFCPNPFFAITFAETCMGHVLISRVTSLFFKMSALIETRVRLSEPYDKKMPGSTSNDMDWMYCLTWIEWDLQHLSASTCICNFR